MPSYKNSKLLEKELTTNEKNLDALFSEFKINNSLARTLQKIKKFYRRAFNETTDESLGNEVVEQFQYLIITLQWVKSGSITPEKAIDAIQEASESRRLDVLLANLLQLCELLAWAAMATVCYVTCISVGLPLMATAPVLGLLITTTTAATIPLCTYNALECFDKFDTFDRVNREESRERALVGFFEKSRPAFDVTLQAVAYQPT